MTDDAEQRSEAPYGEHVFLEACRKPKTFGDHIADRLPPGGKRARRPATRINDRKRYSRDHGQIEHENRTGNEKAENYPHEGLQWCPPHRKLMRPGPSPRTTASGATKVRSGGTRTSTP